MHEYSITCSIISILKKIAADKALNKISKVNFELSPAASLEPESIRFYFDFLTRQSTLLNGAKLSFRKTKIRIKCKSCGRIFSSSKFPPRCSGCGNICLDNNVMPAIADDIRITSVIAD